MWGKVACLLGLHDWSEWRPLDPEQPSEQVRTCSRCSRTKSNAPPSLGMSKVPPNSDRAWIGDDITSPHFYHCGVRGLIAVLVSCASPESASLVVRGRPWTAGF
jgi:hypothetical protein